MTNEVEIDRIGTVQTLRFARPNKKNAITPDMYCALSDALEQADASPDIAVNVFLGSPGVFTAGNDIANFLEFANSPKDAPATPQDGKDRPVSQVFRFINVLPRVKKPMIAAVDGLAVGIGTTLLFHCDLVYASDRSMFKTPFLDLGLVPEAASSLTFPARMGHPLAYEMLVLGGTFSAQRMYEAGALNAVLTPDDVEATALKAAARLATKPPEALAIATQMVRPNADELAKRTQIEAQAFMERLKSPEAVKAFQTFLAKA